MKWIEEQLTPQDNDNTELRYAKLTYAGEFERMAPELLHDWARLVYGALGPNTIYFSW